MLETVIQGGLVVFPQRLYRADLAIGADGSFCAISVSVASLKESAYE
jgi:hypothetical protein